MNKFDIVKILAKEKNLTEKDSHTVVSTIISEITQAIQLGDRVEFRGFGVFFANDREERIARNPKTGEKIVVKKKKIPQFKMAKFFYEILNK